MRFGRGPGERPGAAAERAAADMHKCPRPFSDPAPLFRHGGAVGLREPRLDFSLTVNPLAPPAAAEPALVRSAVPGPDGRAPFARYPDPDCAALVECLAAWHGVGPAQVVVGNGSNELIHALPRAVGARRVAIV